MDLGKVDPVAVEGRIRIPYRWPAGRAGSLFLSVLASEGRLLGLRCPNCRRVSVPPTARCTRCRVECAEHVAVGPEGTVTTWTVSDAGLFALVKLDGADTSLLHRLVGVGPDQARTGMRVRAVFEKDRTGSILDLQGFEVPR